MNTHTWSLLALGAVASLVAPATTAHAQSYEVTASALNVRSSPNGAKIDTVVRGQRVTVSEVRGSWVRIHATQQRWVHSGHLRRPGSGDTSPGSAGSASGYTDYQLKGRDDERGAYAAVVRLEPAADGLIHVTRRAHYKDGKGELHKGYARNVDGLISARLRGQRGAAGALNGEGTDPVDVWIRFRKDGRLELKDASPRGKGKATQRKSDYEGQQAGADASTPAATEARPATAPQGSQRGRHLLAISSKAFKALGRRASREYEVHRFLHVGLGVQIDSITGGDRSAAQRAGQRAGQTWIRSRIQGGVRVPLTTKIPLGDAALELGFEAGARVDYTVVDLYPTPSGFSSALGNLRQMAKRSFDLPLTAGEAQAMNVGAQRVFEGRAHVAISGRLELGHHVGQNGMINVGAKVGVGAYYRIAGRAKIDVRRLQGSTVQVRLGRGVARTRGASVDALLEASLDRGRVKQELAPQIQVIDQALIDQGKLTQAQRDALTGVAEEVAYKAANGVVKKALRVQVKASASFTNSRKFELAYSFDLSRAAAQGAYERAVRGDFTAAALRAGQRGSGVRQDHRVVDIERSKQFAASLELSVVFKASFNRSLRLQSLNVIDGRGVTNYEVTDSARGFETELFGLDHNRSTNLDLVRSSRDANGRQGPSHSLHLVHEAVDATTTYREARRIQRLLQRWGLDSSSGLPLPDARFLRPRYGKTRTRIELWIADHGLTHALTQSSARFREAYGHGYIVVENKNPTTDDNYTAKADRFVRQMEALKAARTHAERGKALSALNSNNLIVIAAIVELAPRSALSVNAEFEGRRIQVKDGVRGAAPTVVVDPRNN